MSERSQVLKFSIQKRKQNKKKTNKFCTWHSIGSQKPTKWAGHENIFQTLELTL